jgi:hypothetical protein
MAREAMQTAARVFMASASCGRSPLEHFAKASKQAS